MKKLVREIKSRFAGPCPVCRQLNLTLYGDGTFDCATTTIIEHAITGDRSFSACPAKGVWERSGGAVGAIKVRLAAVQPDLPLSITLRVEATNGSTMREGFEAVLQILKTFNFPAKGKILMDNRSESPCWKVTVQDVVDSLSTANVPLEQSKSKAIK